MRFAIAFLCLLLPPESSRPLAAADRPDSHMATGEEEKGVKPDSVVRRVWQPGAGQLGYLQLGAIDARKPTVVFVHGSPGSASAHEALLRMPGLGKSCNAISVDRPGYGQSLPRLPERSLAVQASRIGALLGSLPKPLLVVGHSYGGPVALQLGLDCTETVAGLVLVAASVDPDLERTMWIQKVARWPAVRWLVPRDLTTCNEEIIALPPALRLQQPRLAGLRMPVTVLQGEKDGLVPPANASYLARELCQAKPLVVHRYPNLDHFIPFEQPALVIDAVLAMLAHLACQP
jgi:pimeloyl-ACP methyl ester carboxylesterase